LTADGLDVLVVEDDALNVAVAVRLLERQGHRPSAVTDGQSAVQAVQRHHYDVVLMDVEMPRMDGIAATRAIRALGCNVRIIALTGHGTEEHARRCREAGMESVLCKPIDARKLDCAVRRVSPKESGVSPGLPVVDLDAVVARLSGDTELAIDLAEMVRVEAPRLFRELREYVERQSTDEATFVAHSLKGALSNVNARATHVALRIEQLARRAQWSRVQELVLHLDGELAELDLALRDIRTRILPIKSRQNLPLDEQGTRNAATGNDRRRFSNRSPTSR
jgi:CheY-like chemotaxis protein